MRLAALALVALVGWSGSGWAATDPEGAAAVKTLESSGGPSVSRVYRLCQIEDPQCDEILRASYDRIIALPHGRNHPEGPAFCEDGREVTDNQIVSYFSTIYGKSRFGLAFIPVRLGILPRGPPGLIAERMMARARVVDPHHVDVPARGMVLRRAEARLGRAFVLALVVLQVFPGRVDGVQGRYGGVQRLAGRPRVDEDRVRPHQPRQAEGGQHVHGVLRGGRELAAEVEGARLFREQRVEVGAGRLGVVGR